MKFFSVAGGMQLFAVWRTVVFPGGVSAGLYWMLSVGFLAEDWGMRHVSIVFAPLQQTVVHASGGLEMPPNSRSSPGNVYGENAEYAL